MILYYTSVGLLFKQRCNYRVAYKSPFLLKFLLFCVMLVSVSLELVLRDVERGFFISKPFKELILFEKVIC